MDNNDNDDELFKLLEESQKKLDNLKEIKEKQISIDKGAEEQKKSSVPRKIEFTKKIRVKELPKKEPHGTTVSPKPPMSYFPKDPQKSSPQIKSSQANSVPKVKKLKLRPQDIKLNILSDAEKNSEIEKSVKPPKIQIKKIDVENKLDSIKIPDRLKDISTQVKNLIDSKPKKIDSSQKSDISSTLQQFIQERGHTLSPELCAEFIEKLIKSLGESFTLEDVKIAANYFCDIEQNL